MFYKSKKKKILLSTIFTLLLALVIFSVSACGSVQKNDRYYFDFLGTSVVVSIYSSQTFFWQKSKLEKCFDEIEDYLASTSSAFSTEDENSFVSRFNKLEYGQSLQVSAEFLEVFDKAVYCYNETAGVFNPAVKNLVDLWGFSKPYSQVDYKPTKSFDRERNVDGSFPLPNSNYIDAFLSLSDFSKVNVADGVLTKNVPSVIVLGDCYQQEIDLSAIVKGFASDVIKDIIKSYGFENFYVSIGTSSMYLSSNSDGQPFELGITDPNDTYGEPIFTVSVSDRAVATSGTYQNCYTLGDKLYHHVIDANTGAPAETDVLSATIIYDDGALCDAFSTAVVALGKDKGIEFLQKFNGVEYVIITSSDIFTNIND